MKSSSELHVVEVKVRLNEEQSQKLKHLAAFLDIPPAVVARSLLDKSMGRALEEYFLPQKAISERGAA